MKPAPEEENDKDPLIVQTRLRRERRARWLREGDMSVGRRLAQIGVLGWILVAPTLVGIFAGRWLDEHFSSGVFWTAPCMLLGLCLGAWTAWNWMNAR
ncbi:AtpZ/AtpI family protein [Puniceibacterium sediminis]|uniref:ATP synthase protein I n=1 Tax=Puniceibacterium sediminis TaxID=1608407 RepID=A0A238Y051_9RHOB|nr:AtpZ/AtpI family protein [Puniceibacterium sediminis]SNR63679.1 ATP synthase protein I [Puniceibacterium sediminis]